MNNKNNSIDAQRINIHRMFVDDSFRISDMPENGFPYIADQGGIASRSLVEKLLSVCQSHLENLSQEAIDFNNEEHRKEDQKRWEKEREDSDANFVPSRRASRKGFVYLMRNRRNGLTKIGFSKDPKHRESTLQSEEPEIALISVWEGTTSTEEELHEQFARARVRGEWFDLDKVDCDLIEARMTGTGGF